MPFFIINHIFVLKIVFTDLYSYKVEKVSMANAKGIPTRVGKCIRCVRISYSNNLHEMVIYYMSTFGTSSLVFMFLSFSSSFSIFDFFFFLWKREFTFFFFRKKRGKKASHIYGHSYLTLTSNDAL